LLAILIAAGAIGALALGLLLLKWVQSRGDPPDEMAAVPTEPDDGT